MKWQPKLPSSLLQTQEHDDPCHLTNIRWIKPQNSKTQSKNQPRQEKTIDFTSSYNPTSYKTWTRATPKNGGNLSTLDRHSRNGQITPAGDLSTSNNLCWTNARSCRTKHKDVWHGFCWFLTSICSSGLAVNNQHKELMGFSLHLDANEND